MSNLNNRYLSLILVAILLIAGSASYAVAADFAPAVNIPTGKGPSSIVTGYFSSNPLPDILGWWKADGNANDSAGSNNGTTQNGAAYAAGEVGQSFALDGFNDYIKLSNPLPDMTSLTITAWTYYTGGGDFGTIFMDATSTGGNDLVFKMSDSVIGVRADKNGAGLNKEEDAATGLNLGNAWHFIAWTMTSSESRIYVDGVLEATIPTGGSNVGNHAANPSIGRWWDENDDREYFSGRIDDVKIFNRALSASEILGIYNFDTSIALDMAVANFSSNTVSVFLGNGDGTFAPKTDIAVGNRPYSIAAGDFDGDGDIDIAAANSGSDNVSVLLNNGSGNFAVDDTYAVGKTPYSIAVGDFDGDGNLDLAVANKQSNDVSILLGNGDGTFTATSPASFKVGTEPISIIAGNFNTTSKDELAIAHFGSTNVYITSLTGTPGSHALSTPTKYSTGKGPLSMTTGDFNLDGYADLAVANSSGGSISILLGRGNSLFTDPIHFAAGPNPAAIATTDLNGDSFPDLIVSNLTDANVSVLYGNGNGRFQTPLTFSVRKSPQAVAAGDFTSDGMPDIVAANFDSNSVSLLENLWATVITAPAPGEHIPSGATYTVTWDPIPTATTYTLFYSKNNGLSYKAIAKSITGTSYNWTVPIPSGANTVDNMLKVVGYIGKKAIGQGVTPAPFSIDAVNITSPNGGEVWTEETVHAITWDTNTTAKTVTSVKLYYSLDGGGAWTSITTITGSNPGTYNWTLPAVTDSETSVLVKVELLAGKKITASDVSDKFFSIVPAP